MGLNPVQLKKWETQNVEGPQPSGVKRRMNHCWSCVMSTGMGGTIAGKPQPFSSCEMTTGIEALDRSEVM